ncbi:structural protein [Pseudomonas fluorescens]|uniref:structural protein n=1 Tax=Pseudomonas fluorescens TaxID=294 RepID=UPI002035BAC4|nr:structural protein [Pseudomonas fluorescens]
MRPQSSRDIRNFNPGHIRHVRGTRWQGMSANQPNTDFVQFVDPRWGIRAIARPPLITYQDKHDLRTIRRIIGRWAPANENNTENYIRQVATHVGVSPDARIDVYDYPTRRALTQAIIRDENGAGQLPEGNG